jgi:flagellar FliL protein
MTARLKIAVPLAVLLALGAWKLVLAEPAPPKAKLPGTVYVLPREFVVNLAGDRLAKVGVGLILEEPPHTGGGHGAAAPPPEGYGPMPQEAAVRDIVTDELTGAPVRALTTAAGRRRVKAHILRAVEHGTDVHARAVLITDVAVE